MGEIADDCYDRMFEARDRGDYRGDDDECFPRRVYCNRCGSTKVRWRQQGDRWVLFNLGVDRHVCPIDDSSFKAIEP